MWSLSAVPVRVNETIAEHADMVLLDEAERACDKFWQGNVCQR